MGKHLRMIALLSIAMALIGCSDQPSNADARAIFEKQWQKEIDAGSAKVTKFEKVDGVAGELMGVKVYTFKYEAELTWPKGNDLGCKDPNHNPYYVCVLKEIGQKDKITGTIDFQKTEKGWQGQSRLF